MFILLAAAVLALVASRSAQAGPRDALAWGAFLPLALPTWITISLNSLTVDLRTVGAAAGLLLVLAARSRHAPCPWRLSDLLVLVVVAGRVIAEAAAGDLRPLTPLEIARQTWLPYLAGRLLLRGASDLRNALAPVALTVALLGATAFIEATTHTNVYHFLSGIGPGGGEIRLGLKRATGPVPHGIYLGLLLVMLLPWAIEAARRATAGTGPRWWRALPALAFTGLICTLSRGPILAGLLTMGSNLFFRRPRLRWTLAIALTWAGVAAFAARDAIAEFSMQMANEARAAEAEPILIDGEEYQYTGTKHRWLLFVVYARPLAEAGLFGHGHGMHGVRIDPELSRYFFSIDCHYLLLHLRHGWCGTAPLLMLMAAVLWDLLRYAWPARGENAALAGAMLGAYLGVVLVLMTVWLASSFGWVFWLTAGAAANLRAGARPEDLRAD